ncbi:MAG: hypothetical protein M1822_008861 [Bathelium mastoideum]|nr:MAG: hypothetical protein M1822_008861 [Bathelium mastoideum]
MADEEPAVSPNISEQQEQESEFECDGSEWGANSQMSASTDEAVSQDSQEPALNLVFDREYLPPETFSDSDLSAYEEEFERVLDENEAYEMRNYDQDVRAKRIELLARLDITASAHGLESDSNRNSIMRTGQEAIQLVLDFFQDRPHVNRADCEEYCLREYQDESVSPSETRERSLNIHAYISEFQFPNSYMVEIMDISVSSPACMTLFYITSETLDEDQLATAKKFYGDFVPQYTYVGQMGLPSESDHKQLFVWRIVCPAGRPFAADGRRLGLWANQGKYVGILRHFVDFVFEPLQLADGDRSSDEQGWPMVPYNPRLDARNIIVRHDWSGIAGVLLWAAPPVVTLPLGASLCGLLFLEAIPYNEEDEYTNEEGEDTDEEDEHTDEEGNPIFLPPLTGYSRDVYELQRVSMYYLREKVPKLMNDPKLWRRLFAAMMQGVAAANASDLYKKCYERQVNELMWDWFHFEIDPRVSDEKAVVRAENGGKGEDGDVDMDMD